MTRPVVRNSLQSATVGKSILLAGSARSGTTIAGKLLGSLSRVEYFFEPLFSIPLFNAIHRLDEPSWKELYESFVYEQLFLEALAGRNINLNRNDDSCVLLMKLEEEVNQRLSHSFSRVELEKLAVQATPALKLPEAVFAAETLHQYYPDIRLLLMHRDANDVLNSLQTKGWFSDTLLAADHPAQLYPDRIVNNLKVPYWVTEERTDWWVQAAALDRCAYYYYRVTDCIGRNAKHALVLDYDQMLANPAACTERICKAFHLQPGPLTNDIIASVRFQEKDRPSILHQVEPDLQQAIETATQLVEDHTR